MREGPHMECKLVEGWRAYTAQATLVALVISSLLFKRHKERPQRPFRVWLLDVGKQAFSSATCHATNLTFAVLASSSGSTQTTQCSWYFVQYNIDNVLGVSLTILAHQCFIALASCATQNQQQKGKERGSWSVLEAISDCGFYGDPPSLARWAIQVAEWVMSVLVGRFLSGCSTLLLKDVVWYALAEAMDWAFWGHPSLLVFFVLVIYPLICCITVAWIQDGVLKKVRLCSSEEEPLLGDDSSESDLEIGSGGESGTERMESGSGNSLSDLDSAFDRMQQKVTVDPFERDEGPSSNR